MSSKLGYFRFVPSDWVEGDIGYLSYEAQGLYLRLCLNYWTIRQKGAYTREKLVRRFKGYESNIEEFIQDGLIKHNPETDEVSITFMDRQLDKIQEISRMRSEVGAKGGSVKPSAKKPETPKPSKTPEIKGVAKVATVDGKKIKDEEFKRLAVWHKNYQDNRSLAFEDIAKKKNTIPAKIRELKFDSKAVTQAIRLMREGVEDNQFDNACCEAFYDDYHQDQNLKYVTPEYITRDNMYGKFIALSESK